MATALPSVPQPYGISQHHAPLPPRRTPPPSLARSRSSSNMSTPRDTDRSSDPSSKSKTPSLEPSSQHSSLLAPRRGHAGSRSPRKLRSQYPRGSGQKHVSYILVASFDIDRGPVMEHQYPDAISGDENMLAELMLPDQAHARKQDWTIFFLHKERDEEEKRWLQRRRRRNRDDGNDGITDDSHHQDHDSQDDEDDEDDWSDSQIDGNNGARLVHVLNLVNTKHDKSVKRGAIVRAMAICTRHPFLHIYKPLLLLALEEYFKAPRIETLAMLYQSVNAMDLSLMPRLRFLERHLLLGSDNKDLFVEKFEQMIQMRMAMDRGEDLNNASGGAVGEGHGSPAKMAGISRTGTKAHVEGGNQSIYSVPRDTHEFETKVLYKGIPIPVKVPTAVMPETVGDFSLIKLIQNFSEPHAKSPQPFPPHPQLTTSGPNTHPFIVLVNALLTQKRIIFLGHNMPSGEVAEAVLAACSLASGGVLRGFTRHAFPYTDLSKIENLLTVPGFIAGVTNPTFENHPEWWDVMCDLPTGRIKISSKIDAMPTTEGLVLFQQQNPSLASIAGGNLGSSQDLTGDASFMADILRSISARHGERVIRAKWRDWIIRFTRITAQFEEIIYGASALYVGGDELEMTLPGASGHGYVWPDDATKNKELAGYVTRIEGWRNTRSYFTYIKDLAKMYACRPLKGLDLAHIHDRLRMQRLSATHSRDIYLTLARHVHSYDEICLLLLVAPEAHAGLFYLGLGLLHKEREVRLRTAELLERVAEHEAGQHWWKGLSRFEKLAFERVRRELDTEPRARPDRERSSLVVDQRLS